MPKLHTLVLIFAAAALACSPPDSPQPWQISERLMEETSEVFTRHHIVTWEEIFTWTFESPEDLEAWQGKGFDLASRHQGDHWLLGASKTSPFLERSVSFHSNGIDRIEVTLQGLRKRPLLLQWAPPDKPWAQHRTLVAKDPQNQGHYVFDLAAHASWQGKIDRLRLLPRMRPKLRGQLIAVRGLRSVVDPARHHEAGSKPFKVALDQTSRTGRWVVPGSPFVRRVEVGSAQQLEVSFGIDPEARHNAAFRIEAVADDGRVTELFTATVSSHRPPPDSHEEIHPHIVEGSLAPGRWHSTRLDLSPWAGRSLDLRFITEAVDPGATDADPSPPGSVYGFWGDLRMSRRQDGPSPPNVVLVVVDTLRADHLSLYGYPRPTSPNLERWAAEEAVTFRSAIAPSPWTFPSHLSLFTGLDTLSHGRLYSRPLPDRLELLAQRLQRAGYETMAITGGGFMDAHYGFARGFDRYHVIPTRLWPDGDLLRGLEKARQWTADAHRPYFLFLHTYEVHTPHRVRQPFYRQLTGHDGDAQQLTRLINQQMPLGETAGAVRRKSYGWLDDDGRKRDLAAGDLQQVIDAYDSAIAYTDHHLGGFLEELSADDGEEMIIITSDHGEALGEQGLAGHAYLYDINLEIPLLISLPDGRGAGKTVDDQVRLVDVAPTLLQTLGLPVPAMDGVSLLPFFDGGVVKRPEEAELAWSATAFEGVSLRRSNRLKYIHNSTIWQRREAPEALFKLDDDPDELQNLAPGHGATDALRQRVAQRLVESLDGLLIALRNPTAEEWRVTLDGVPWLGSQFIRSLDAPAEAMEFLTGRRLSIRVAPGERFSAMVAQVTPQDPLRIRIDGGAGPCALPLPIASPTHPSPTNDPVTATFDDACRATSGGDDVDGFSLQLLWRNPMSAGGGDSPKLPHPLREQLQSLGYLD